MIQYQDWGFCDTSCTCDFSACKGECVYLLSRHFTYGNFVFVASATQYNDHSSNLSSLLRGQCLAGRIVTLILNTRSRIFTVIRGASGPCDPNGGSSVLTQFVALSAAWSFRSLCCGEFLSMTVSGNRLSDHAMQHRQILASPETQNLQLIHIEQPAAFTRKSPV